MIRELKNAKLPTEYPLHLAIWVYAKRMGVCLIVVAGGGILLTIPTNSWLVATALQVLFIFVAGQIYLFFQLWLAHRDANILRQVPVVRPTPANSGSGCLGTLLLVVVVIAAILVAWVILYSR